MRRETRGNMPRCNCLRKCFRAFYFFNVVFVFTYRRLLSSPVWRFRDSMFAVHNDTLKVFAQFSSFRAELNVIFRCSSHRLLFNYLKRQVRFQFILTRVKKVHIGVKDVAGVKFASQRHGWKKLERKDWDLFVKVESVTKRGINKK